MTVVYLVAAFILGGCCGVVLASILTAAGRADTPFQDLPGSRSSSGGPGTCALREPGSTPLPPPRPADSLESAVPVRHIKLVP